MQLKSNRAFQLALRARSSLDQAFDDVIEEGLKKRSAAALQSITSAYAGAKGAVMVGSLELQLAVLLHFLRSHHALDRVQCPPSACFCSLFGCRQRTSSDEDGCPHKRP